MGIPINRDYVPNPDNPSFEVLHHCVKQHQKKLERFDKLDKYYNGEHDILKRSRENETSKNQKVVVNHAKYITDITVGFMIGNPIAYSAPDDDQNFDLITDEYDRMDVVSHDTELEKDLSVFGEGLELLYLGRLSDIETEIRIESIDPRGGFVVTDDTIEKNPLFAVHYYKRFNLQGKEDGYIFNVYTPHFIITYKTKNGRNIHESNTEFVGFVPHYFQGVPIVEYRNNEERQGDYEQLTSLIDAYNALQSDRISDKEAFVDALLIMYGFMLEGDEELSDMIKGGLIDAPTRGGEDGAFVEWLTKTFDESQVQLLSKSIEDNIHKISFVPNLNDENFAGNISGEAMKYKLFGLLQLLSTKVRYFKKGLKQRLKLMEHILNVKGQNVNVEGAKITVKPNLPVNVTDIIDQIDKSSEFIPLLVSLGWLPDIDDPQKIIDMLREQKEEEIKMNQRAMGYSHSESEEIDDEEEDDDSSNLPN